MSPAASAFLSRFASYPALPRRDRASLVITALLHATALIIMVATESDLASKTTFLLAWLMLNFFWLVLLRRPAIAALASLAMIAVLILLSQFKYDKLMMTVNFVDLMILDTDTISFFLTIYPDLLRRVILAALVIMPTLGMLWWLDPYRVRRRVASTSGTLCLAVTVGISIAAPMEPSDAFSGDGYVSKFVNSGVDAVVAYMTRGYMESDAHVAGDFRLGIVGACKPAAKPPHIIMILDESSFDIRKAPDIKVPAGYGRHFHSFDGKERSFIVEGSGGPTWFAEYSALTGLSARSFGRFAYFVTRIAAGRVERGLPRALQRCGYRTFTLYPARGAFMSARSFQKTAGVQQFRDSTDMRAKGIEPDSFFYDQAAQVIAREGKSGPLFIFSYLAANHFPWDFTYRPDLTPEWRPLGNLPNVDEYVRRQGMSERDYAAFLERLRHEFPGESFLLVRFGDHQPDFADHIIDPTVDDGEIASRLDAYDPRYFTTYYAMDAINFKPADVSSALPTLEAPYLPLVVQEAAGLPLDPTWTEQKRILQRCNGLFYGCAGGAEARRFNRVLIEAGLIKGL
jgi:hypothetical protein